MEAVALGSLSHLVSYVVLPCPFPSPSSSSECPDCLSVDTPYADPASFTSPSCPFGPSRSQASSESEVDDEGPCGGDGDPGLFPFPLPRGGAQASSEESEEEGTSDDLHLPPDCHYATRPPRPQAVRTQDRELGLRVAKSRRQMPSCISGSTNHVLSSASSFAHLEAGW